MDTTIVVLCDGDAAADGQNLNNALPLCVCSDDFSVRFEFYTIIQYIIHCIVIIIYSVAFVRLFPSPLSPPHHSTWAIPRPTFVSPHRSAVIENTQEFLCFIGIFYFHIAFGSIVLLAFCVRVCVGGGFMFTSPFSCAQYVWIRLTRFQFQSFVSLHHHRVFKSMSR